MKKAFTILAAILIANLPQVVAQSDTNDVRLEWANIYNESHSLLIVEQLNTATNEWVEKGAATLSTTNNTVYEFTDRPLQKGGNILYYRLKTTDATGKASASPILKVDRTLSTAQVKLMSNPVTTNEVRFQISGISNDTKVNARVVDMNGRVVATLSNIPSGVSTVSLMNQAKGSYRLMVFTDNGKIEQGFVKL